MSLDIHKCGYRSGLPIASPDILNVRFFQERILREEEVDGYSLQGSWSSFVNVFGGVAISILGFYASRKLAPTWLLGQDQCLSSFLDIKQICKLSSARKLGKPHSTSTRTESLQTQQIKSMRVLAYAKRC